MRKWVWFVIYEAGFEHFGQAQRAVKWAENIGLIVKKIRGTSNYDLSAPCKHTGGLRSVGSITKEVIQ